MPQRTKISIGSANAEVTLLKVAGDPPEASYDVRRGDAAPRSSGTGNSTSGNRVVNKRGGGVNVDFASGSIGQEPSEIRHGLWLDVGAEEPEWVDLTDELAEIDKRTVIEGMTIVDTLDLTTIDGDRIRDAHYISAAADGAAMFLAHLWTGLRRSRTAALVKWTKRKNQALGVIVAQGGYGGEEPHLVLRELEWAAAMREIPERARLTTALSFIPDAGAAAAVDAMRALRKPPSILDDIADDRQAQRVELLEATRARTQWKPPEREAVPVAVDALGDALLAAAK